MFTLVTLMRGIAAPSAWEGEGGGEDPLRNWKAGESARSWLRSTPALVQWHDVAMKVLDQDVVCVNAAAAEDRIVPKDRDRGVLGLLEDREGALRFVALPCLKRECQRLARRPPKGMQTPFL